MFATVSRRVASLAVLVAASLATPLAYAADDTPAPAPSPAPVHHHAAVREVGGATKKHVAAGEHGRGRRAQHDKKEAGKKHDAPAKHTGVARPGHANALPPSIVIGAPVQAAPPPPPVRNAPHAAAPAHGCQKHAVTIVAGDEDASFSLASCDGHAATGAAERLAILARPSGAAEPHASLAVMEHKRGPMIAPGIRRASAGIVERLQKVADHFSRPGKSTKIVVVSLYRPQGGASYHATARAVDFRVEGVAKDALVAFCKTLEDTGCGYYPSSDFIHMDARDPGTGHVSWIDASGGEAGHERGAIAHHATPSDADAAPSRHEADMDPPAVLAVPDSPETWQP